MSQMSFLPDTTYGLEAGLGLELAKNPNLALLWANELTDGAGRAVLLRGVGQALVSSDPAAAFALGQELPEGDRAAFLNSLYANWAWQDTAAAIEWANQLSDPDEQNGAIQAIRSAAPVGIGTQLSIRDGYPVVEDLLPGSPADLSGQLHIGDTIVGIAQGDNLFVDVQNLPLQEVVQSIRGNPNSVVQLQVLSADTPPDSAPQVITLTRNQIVFKR